MVDRNDSPQSVCKEFEQDLVLYYYRECEENRRSKVESHLQSCACCRHFLEELRGLLPMTVKPDEPPQAFWESYSQEIHRRLAAAEQKDAWWKGLVSVFRPWPVPALATATVLILVVALTFTKGIWRLNQPPAEEKAFLEVVSVADNLDFFNAMDFLDSMDLLETLEGRKIQKSETKDQAL